MNEQEEHQRPLKPDAEIVRRSSIIIGAVLVVAGAWAMLDRLGVISPAFDEVWRVVRSMSWGLAAIALGVAVIVWSSDPARPHMPARGTRLYRSRDDRWVAGVLGGLGEYFGVSPVVLRLAFIALAIAGWGALVFAYIVMAVVMPQGPGPAAR